MSTDEMKSAIMEANSLAADMKQFADWGDTPAVTYPSAVTSKEVLLLKGADDWSYWSSRFKNRLEQIGLYEVVEEVERLYQLNPAMDVDSLDSGAPRKEKKLALEILGSLGREAHACAVSDYTHGMMNGSVMWGRLLKEYVKTDETDLTKLISDFPLIMTGDEHQTWQKRRQQLRKIMRYNISLETFWAYMSLAESTNNSIKLSGSLLKEKHRQINIGKPVYSKMTMSDILTMHDQLNLKDDHHARSVANNSKPKGGKSNKSDKKCSHCDKKGHLIDTCYQLHPEMKPKAKAKADNIVNSVCCTARSQSTEWILDSGSDCHISWDKTLFVKLTKPIDNELVHGVGGSLPVLGKGTIMLRPIINGHTTTLQVNNVLYVPDISSNIISTLSLSLQGLIGSHTGDKYTIMKQNGEVIMEGRRGNASWELIRAKHFNQSLSSHLATNLNPSWDLWHSRFGHASTTSIKQAAGIVDGINAEEATAAQNDEQVRQLCPACIVSKQTKARSHDVVRLNPERSLVPGKRVHIDISGGGNIAHTQGVYKYALLMVDEATDMSFSQMLASREMSGIIAALKRLLVELESRFGWKPSFLRADREFPGKRSFDELCLSHGIIPEPTAPESPHQNGTVERQHRTLYERVRAMLTEAKLPDQFWGYAFTYALMLKNMLPAKVLKYKKTPWEASFGKRPDVSRIRRFGCVCYMPTRGGGGKLSAKGMEGRFLGYATWNFGTTFVYCLDSKKVMETSAPIFDELREVTRIGDLSNDVQYLSAFKSDAAATADDALYAYGDWDGGADEMEVSSSVPILASPDDSLTDVVRNDSDAAIAAGTNIPLSNSEQIDQNDQNDADEADILAAEEPETTPEPSRSSTRGVPRRDYKAISSGKSYIANGIFAQASHNVYRVEASPEGMLPRTYNEAMRSNESSQWQAACSKEIDSLTKSDVWDLVPKPKGAKVIPGRWVFAKKYHADGTIARYKARWVIKGFKQQYGVNYVDTFATVVNPTSWRSLIAMATFHDWEIELSDVDTAFMNSELTDAAVTVWSTQPDGFEQYDDNRELLICRMKKALPGLKQGARAWYLTLSTHLQSFGFHPMMTDSGVFHNNAKAYIATHVDDMLLIAPDQHQIDMIKDSMSRRFGMKHLGAVKHYLGLDITRDRKLQQLQITQVSYIRQLLQQIGPVRYYSTPASQNLPPPYDGDPSDELCQQYQSLVGILAWIGGMTRPDIAYIVNFLQRSCHKPSDAHMAAAKRVVGYLAATPNTAIVFSATSPNNPPNFVAYSDASWNDDPHTGKSTTGYITKMCGGPISWSTSSSKVVALSTAEAEFLAAAEATKEVKFLRQLFEEMDHNVIGPSTLFIDNQAAICIANGAGKHSATKHIRLRLSFIREAIQCQDIIAAWIGTADMVADALTKVIPAPKWSNVCATFGLVDAK